MALHPGKTSHNTGHNTHRPRVTRLSSNSAAKELAGTRKAAQDEKRRKVAADLQEKLLAAIGSGTVPGSRFVKDRPGTGSESKEFKTALAAARKAQDKLKSEATLAFKGKKGIEIRPR